MTTGFSEKCVVSCVRATPCIPVARTRLGRQPRAAGFWRAASCMSHSGRKALALFVLAVAACDSPPPAAEAPDAGYDPCAFTVPGAPWVAFSSARTGSYQLFAVRADGTCLRQLTYHASQNLFPSWSRSGKVAFASDRSGTLGIWLHDLATGADAPLALGGLYATSPAVSRDGASLAFAGHVAGTTSTDVYVASSQGGDPVKLTGDSGDNAGPAWSPDGKTIYFVSTRTGAYEVFSVPASGGAATQVTTGSRIVGKPSVAPDGSSLAYARTISGSSATEVVTYDLVAGTTHVVTSQEDSEPAFDPSGTRLAVRSFRSGVWPFQSSAIFASTGS